MVCVCVCVFMPIKPGYCHIQCLVFHLKLSSLFKTVFWSQHLLYNLFIIYIYFWLMIFDSVSYGFYNFSFFLLNCNNDVLRVCLLFLFRWIILQFWNYCPWSWKSESMSYLDIIKKNFIVQVFFLNFPFKTGSEVLIAANEKNGGYFNFLASFHFEGIIFDFLYYSFVFIFWKLSSN